MSDKIELATRIQALTSQETLGMEDLARLINLRQMEVTGEYGNVGYTFLDKMFPGGVTGDAAIPTQIADQIARSGAERYKTLGDAANKTQGEFGKLTGRGIAITETQLDVINHLNAPGITDEVREQALKLARVNMALSTKQLGLESLPEDLRRSVRGRIGELADLTPQALIDSEKALHQKIDGVSNVPPAAETAPATPAAETPAAAPAAETAATTPAPAAETAPATPAPAAETAPATPAPVEAATAATGAETAAAGAATGAAAETAATAAAGAAAGAAAETPAPGGNTTTTNNEAASDAAKGGFGDWVKRVGGTARDIVTKPGTIKDELSAWGKTAKTSQKFVVYGGSTAAGAIAIWGIKDLYHGFAGRKNEETGENEHRSGDFIQGIVKVGAGAVAIAALVNSARTGATVAK